MEELGMSSEKTQAQQLDAYLEANVDGYVQYLEFPFIKYFVMGIDMVNQIIPYALIFSIVMMGVACFFLYRMKLKKEEFLKHIGCSFITSGFMLSVLPSVILMNNIFVNIKLTPEYFYHFFVAFFNNYFYMMLGSGIIFLVLGILIQNIKSKKIKGEEKEEQPIIENSKEKISN